MLSWSTNAQIILCERYLATRTDRKHAPCDFCDRLHETPLEMLERASFGVPTFLKFMTSGDGLPNSPTLFNAGLPTGGTFSGCFKFDVADMMLGEGSITDIATLAAAVQKWGGGVGYTVSDVRQKGSIVNSTHGSACGPLAVLRHYHSVAYNLITQGGKRDGAQMGILHVDHPDIREFIDAKNDLQGTLSSFNLSVAMTDQVMKAALADLEGSEAGLLTQIATSAHRTGDPGMYFIDIAEATNPTPWLGKLTGTNPCGEVPLLNYEACNLGSINLANFVVGDRVDLDRLASVTDTAVRYLDTILDNNSFPDPRIANATLATRKLGLGVMGWADMLMALNIHYDTNEALDLAEMVMDTIQREAHKTSKLLAKEKYIPSGLWPLVNDRPEEARRNATLTCIAPTGSISILAGVSSGIEPHFALENTRVLGSGQVLREQVNHNGFIPKVSHEIGWPWHIWHQATFQRFTDLAVSKTINLPEEASVDDIRSAYVMMWQENCKGGTVYRNRSRPQVLEDCGHDCLI